MTGVIVLTILIFILYCQASNGQQNGVATNCQQTVQNNVGFSQTADPANLNIQMQQSAKQASSSQQSYNLQQLANIPMQTFNVQQPVNFQQQANSPPLNYQPVNQAMGIQQVPQSINVQDVQQHDIQQTLSNPVHLQHAPVVQPVSLQQSSNVKAATPSVIMQQQAHPIQAASFQQQAFPVTLQQQQVPTPNSQQTTPQCVNLQNSVVVQPGSLQQQTLVHNGNLQQIPEYQGNYHQPSQPYVNIQQQSAQIQQPSVIVQPVTTYQQPITMQEPIVKQLNIQKCTLQDPHNVQQMQIQQMDPQQKQVPCHNIGGYQVVSYQKPCQQPDVAAALPMSLQQSKIPSNPYPMVIAAVPAVAPDSNKEVQRSDHMYLMSPQNYVHAAPYTSALVKDNMQQVLLGLNTTPITALPNSNPASAVNLVITNPNQCAETIDNRSSSLKTSDLGLLSILQGQLPVSSLLSQPTSSIESALLSSILSSIQNPASSPQYVMSNYPSQTALNPQCNSQNSKFSFKSLLPILLNLLQEKYSGCGCQCQCCNCECSQNDNDLHEAPKQVDNEEVQEEAETREESPIDIENSLEEEDIPINPRHREKSKYQNMIPDDSAEIDETQDSSCGVETDDVGTGSGDEEDILNDSSKL